MYLWMDNSRTYWEQIFEYEKKKLANKNIKVNGYEVIGFRILFSKIIETYKGIEKLQLISWMLVIDTTCQKMSEILKWNVILL